MCVRCRATYAVSDDGIPFLRVSFSSRRRCHDFDKKHSMYYVNDGVFKVMMAAAIVADSRVEGKVRKMSLPKKTEENEIHRQHPT